MTRGAVRLTGHALKAGAGAALSEEPRAELEGSAEAEVLLFDLG